MHLDLRSLVKPSGSINKLIISKGIVDQSEAQGKGLSHYVNDVLFLHVVLLEFKHSRSTVYYTNYHQAVCACVCVCLCKLS